MHLKVLSHIGVGAKTPARKELYISRGYSIP